MQNSNNASAGKIAIATLTGLAIGTVLGIVMAQHKGSVERSKLLKKLNGLKQKFSGVSNAEVQAKYLIRPPLI